MSALIWHFAAALAFIGTSAAFASDCESHLASPLFQATRYFSLEELTLKSESDLRAMLPRLDRLLVIVQAKRTALSAQPTADRSPSWTDEWNRFEQDENNIKQMSAAIGRRLEGIHAHESPPEDPPPIFDVNVTGLKPNEVLAKITALTKDVGPGNERHVFRYFAAAREDLMRRYGTDLHAREFGPAGAWYDEFGLEATLKTTGLKAEDGFYGVDYANAIYMGRDQKGEVIPFSMIEDFIQGDRALAIYDYDQLEDFSTDFWVFKDPPRKKHALLAIVRPRR